MALTLDSIRGRIGDIDAHEMIPTRLYREVFGDIAQRFLDENPELWQVLNMVPEDHPMRLTAEVADDAEISEQSVWERKGIWAPSYADMDRRLEVMDVMGVRRQLIIPGFGHLSFIQALGGGVAGAPVATPTQMALGRECIDAYNVWAGRMSGKYPERLSMVGILMTDEPTPELLTKKAEALIATGLKSFQIPSSLPPAGLSPADPRLDPFYAAVAAANVSLIFHPPTGMGFRKSDVWEAAIPPYLHAITVLHQAEENYLAALVLGGVFERHPTLRVGFIETGASWIGPLAERMDWGGVSHAPIPLPMKPSEYLVRNVRASVLLSEPVEVWLERWPHLQEVYCWSSDYPHVEGLPWALQESFKRVAPLGDEVVEKFFVRNSELILPVPA